MALKLTGLGFWEAVTFPLFAFGHYWTQVTSEQI